MAENDASLNEEDLRAVAVAVTKQTLTGARNAYAADFLTETIVTDILFQGVPQNDKEAAHRYAEVIQDNFEAEPEDLDDFYTALCSQLASLDSSDSDSDGELGGCEMCERVMALTKHHLIPRDVHSQYKKKGYSAEQLNTGVMICRQCHSAIHRTYDNKLLAAQYRTLEQLLQSPELQRFINWAKKQRVSNKVVLARKRRPRK